MGVLLPFKVGLKNSRTKIGSALSMDFIYLLIEELTQEYMYLYFLFDTPNYGSITK